MPRSLARDTLDTLRVSAHKAALAHGHAPLWEGVAVTRDDGRQELAAHCVQPRCHGAISVTLMPPESGRANVLRGTMLASTCPTPPLEEVR